MESHQKKGLEGLEPLNSKEIINIFKNGEFSQMGEALQGAYIHRLMKLEDLPNIEEVSRLIDQKTKFIANRLREFLDRTKANTDSQTLIQLIQTAQMDDIMTGSYIYWLMQMKGIKSQRQIAKELGKSPAFVSSRLKAYRDNVEQRRGRPAHTTYNLDELIGEDIPLRIVSKIGDISTVDLAQLLKRTSELLKLYEKELNFEEVYQNQVINHVLDFDKIFKAEFGPREPNCDNPSPLKVIIEKKKLSAKALRKIVKTTMDHYEKELSKDESYTSITRAFKRGQSSIDVEFQSTEGSMTISNYHLALIDIYYFLDEFGDKIMDFYETIEVEEKTNRGRHRYMSIDLTEMELVDENSKKAYIPFKVISKEGEMPRLDLILLLNEASYRLLNKAKVLQIEMAKQTT